MRVIAGTAKSLQLKAPKGMETRPTSDRVKETLFNILTPYLAGCRFLDLFSGSGGIAIEALSRGAREATLVEQNQAALACITQNLTHTGFQRQAKVIRGEVLQVLKFLKGKEGFDCIFLDPPYGKEWEKKVLLSLQEGSLLNPKGIIVVEAVLETDFSYVDTLGFTIVRKKKYGSNQHVFLTKE